MTEIELIQLSPNDKYTFHLYHGGLLIGYPEQEDNKWYIVNRNQSNKESTAGSIGHLILPEQIDKIEPIYHRNKQRVTPNPPSYVIEGSPKTKIMVIFGAGASLDYTFDQEDSVRPPLGKDLFSDTFSNLISQFKGVESLSSQILQSKNIEIFFQEQWNNIKNTHNPKLLNKLIDTQYYLHYLFRHLSTTCRNNRKNNYSSFFQSLENYLITKGWDEKAMIVSFNYDTLIENALSHSLDYNFTDFGDYINYKKSRFLLFKPHGSWNWVRYISEKFLDSINFNYVEKNLLELRQTLIQKGISLSKINEHLDEGMAIINKDLRTNQGFYYPMLLIPYKKKDSFIMPELHFTAMQHFMQTVEKIIIIGWKGSEEKFKSLLAKNIGSKKIEIIYVTKNDSSIEHELKESLPNATFSNFSPQKDSQGTFTELNQFIQEFPNRIF